MIEIFAKMLMPLRRKIALMISRVVIESVNDAEGIQFVKITGLNGELMDGIELMQQYGFTSVPFGDAEGICGFVGGNRNHGVVFAVGDRRYRLKGLKDGEVALYDDQGSKVHLKRDGIIAIESSAKVQMKTPDFELDGNMAVSGNVAIAGNTSMDQNLDVGLNLSVDGNIVAIGTVSGADCISSSASLNGFYATYLTHTHSGVTTGGGISGPPVP